MSYVVEVNEGVVDASGQGRDFWHQHRQRFIISGQLTEIKPGCIVGGLSELGPWPEETARFMASYMTTTGGMPPKAVRVKRPTKTT